AAVARPSPGVMPSATVSERPRSKRRLFAMLALVVIAAAAVMVWRRVAATATPADVIVLSGRIEADEAAVAPKLGGRILEIRVREGDVVKPGEVIAVIGDEQVRAREVQASAALMQAEARAKSARDKIGVLEQQLRQAQLH